jgi:hypothetical protein
MSVEFKRRGETDSYVIEQKFSKPQLLRLRLVARHDRIAAVTVDGAATAWHLIENSVGAPRIDVLAAAAARQVVVVKWTGEPVQRSSTNNFARIQQGQMRWWTAPTQKVGASLDGARGRQQAAPLQGKFESIDLTASFNDRVTQIFKNEYRAPRSPFVSLALPKQGLGGWAGGVNTTAEIDDSGLRALAAKNGGKIILPTGESLMTPGAADAKNVLFVSQWENYPREATAPLSGKSSRLVLLMAGSTNPLQSRMDNGEVIVTYLDGTTTRLALANPETWWPIEQDYFIDDFQFPHEGWLPMRVDLKTGKVRVLEEKSFKGQGGKIPGGAATVLEMELQPDRELKSLTVRALANDVVIGLMAATLVR